MDKLLHERLREIIDDINDAKLSTSTDMIDFMREILNVDETDSYDKDLQNIIRYIADEIEKYYIPRPRFEDGEPVQSSDMEEIGGLATCCVYMDGSWKFDPDKYEDERNPKPWDEQQGRQCDFIKRPEPKALDAEGNEIKVGDTLFTKNGESNTVKSVHGSDEHPVKGLHKAGKPFVRYEGGRWNFADEVTHREPDSLEKLQRDMSSAIKGVKGQLFECDRHINMDTVEKWSERLTALVERDA